MDWGLFRKNEPGPNRFLREKLNYSPWFYYWSIVTDFILRYIFFINFFYYKDPSSLFIELQTMTIIMVSCEAFRRAQWSLLRVENEQNNNLEAYRTIPIIPPIINSRSKTTNQE